jgi:hypothetical protein
MDQETRDAVEALWIQLYFNSNKALRFRPRYNAREEKLLKQISLVREWLDRTQTLVESQREAETSLGDGACGELRSWLEDRLNDAVFERKGWRDELPPQALPSLGGAS